MAATQRLVDARGRELSPSAAPLRIVSLVPSTTETLFALGAGPRVVGVTRYCVHPAAAVAALPKVGGTKKVDLDAVRRLAPDLVLANLEENRKEEVEALDAAGLPVFVQHPRTARGAAAALRELGALAGAEAPAEVHARAIEAAIAEADSMPPQEPRPRVACLVWRRPFFAVGDDTYIADLIRLAGGGNAFEGRPERYFEVDLDGIALARPDVLLLPDEPYPFSERHLADFSARSGIPAVAAGRIRIVDGQDLCWHGIRTPAGIRMVRRILDGLRTRRSGAGSPA